MSGCTAIHRMIHSTHTALDFTLTPHTHAQSSAYAVRLGGAGACEAVLRSADDTADVDSLSQLLCFVLINLLFVSLAYLIYIFVYMFIYSYPY